MGGCSKRLISLQSYLAVNPRNSRNFESANSERAPVHLAQVTDHGVVLFQFHASPPHGTVFLTSFEAVLNDPRKHLLFDNFSPLPTTSSPVRVAAGAPQKNQLPS